MSVEFKPYLLDEREELRVLFYRVSEQSSPKMISDALSACGHSGLVPNDTFGNFNTFRTFIERFEYDQRQKFTDAVNSRYTERK